MKESPGVEELLEGTPASVFESVVLRSAAAMDGPVVILLLDHLDLIDLYLTDVYPESPGVSQRLPLRVENGHLQRVLCDHETVHAPAAEWHVQPFETPHLSAAPLSIRDTAIGAMLFGSEEEPTERQLDELRRLGVKSGVAISVADQYTDLVETRRRTTPSIAAELQSAQLPSRSLYTPEVQVVGSIEPAYEVGGDWFDYTLDSDRLLVAVCDGVGRGLIAASISYVTLGAVRNARKSGASLEKIAELAHQALSSSTTYEQFATLLLASIDLTTLQMDMMSVAHPAPIMVPAPGGGYPEVLYPTHSYPPLGAFDKGESYTSSRYDLAPGSRLLLFSDGATERRDGSGRQLGIEGLLKYTEEARGLLRMDFVRSLMHKIGDFNDSALEDDITIVGVDLPPFG